MFTSLPSFHPLPPVVSTHPSLLISLRQAPVFFTHASLLISLRQAPRLGASNAATDLRDDRGESLAIMRDCSIARAAVSMTGSRGLPAQEPCGYSCSANPLPSLALRDRAEAMRAEVTRGDPD